MTEAPLQREASEFRLVCEGKGNDKMTKRRETNQLESTRRCTGPCKEEYQLTNENFAQYTPGTFKRQCRRCEAARSKTHYDQDPQRKNQQVAASRRKNRTAFNVYRRDRTKRIMTVYRESVAKG